MIKAKRPCWTIQKALSTVLAVVRISNDGLLCYFIKIEHIHRTDLFTQSASNTFIQIISSDCHFDHLAKSFFCFVGKSFQLTGEMPGSISLFVR